MPPNMLWATSGSLVVTVHGEQAPTDVEWDVYIEECKLLVGVLRSSLVFSDGGGPTTAQRARIIKVKEFVDVPLAVISASAMARGIVTAMSWLGKNIRAYSPTEMSRAFQYLSVPETERPQALEQVAALRARLLGSDLRATATQKDAVEVAQLMTFIATQRLPSVKAKLASLEHR